MIITTQNVRYRDDIQSDAVAIENMLLMATAMGVSGCWIGHLPSAGVLRRMFGIPSAFLPVAGVVLGYAANETVPMPRKHRLDDIVATNRFPFCADDVGRSQVKVLLVRLLLWVYDRTPIAIKRRWLNAFIDRRWVRKWDI